MTDCTKYIACIPEWVQYKCNFFNGYFDSYTLDCVNDYANCSNEYDPNSVCTMDLIGLRKPDENECSYFYECNNVKKVKSCPTGKSYNPKTKQCDMDLNSEYCQKGNTVICDQSELYNTRRLVGDPNIISLCVKEYISNDSGLKFCFIFIFNNK